MPTYDYICLKCKTEIEVLHTIAELEKPSPETKEEITCCGKLMVRHYPSDSAPAIKTPTNRILMDKSRRKRNKDHFKKEVLPTMDRDSAIHHQKKLGYKVNTKKMGLVG